MVTRQDLSKYSQRLIDFLAKQKIDSIKAIQDRKGVAFEIAQGESIDFEERPSGRGIIPTDTAMTMSYIVDRVGIPIELRFNNSSGYVYVTIKCDRLREGYTLFLRDVLNNQIQTKRLEYSFEGTVKELEDLAK